MIKTLIKLIILLCFYNIGFACTSFGIINESGVIIGKNRDALYGKQTFELMKPTKQFISWFDNPYHHKNEFYAIISDNDVKMGVNKFGLAIIEEDPVFPADSATNRKYYQPFIGYSEGSILYGILQNFVSVEEIIPYINDIFSLAAPNFYQISDTHKILTVEVAYGDSNNDTRRQFTYKIISKNGDYFTHTNTYLSPQFESLNINNIPNGSLSSDTRLKKITQDVLSNNNNSSNIYNWLMDIKSSVSIPSDQNSCQNTSIFRSNLKGLTKIYPGIKTDRVYGTVSNFIVSNNSVSSSVYVRIIDSINVLKNGNQKITYRELKISLDKLFSGKSELPFKQKKFIRQAPINGICN